MVKQFLQGYAERSRRSNDLHRVKGKAKRNRDQVVVCLSGVETHATLLEAQKAEWRRKADGPLTSDECPKSHWIFRDSGEESVGRCRIEYLHRWHHAMCGIHIISPCWRGMHSHVQTDQRRG